MNVNIDETMLKHAQRLLRTTTVDETVNKSLELAAAVDVDRRDQLLESFRDLLGRMDLAKIEREEANDHLDGTA